MQKTLTKIEVPSYGADKTDMKTELNPKIFGVTPNSEVIYQVVYSLLASKRNTVASTKTRGEVSGGGKKPWKQKGTGRARAGSIRSPLWRGGGITFGPSAERNFSRKVNKKTKKTALLMALSDKANSGKIVIVDRLDLANGKTRELKAIIDQIVNQYQLGKTQVLIVPARDEKILRAGRNIPSLAIRPADQINILEVLKADSVIVYRDALSVIEKAYLR